MNTLTLFMFILLSTPVNPHSDLERMESMFEETLLRHPEHTLKNPAETFYNNFETFRLFWEALGERYMSEKCYWNKNSFKKRDEKAYILYHDIHSVSEVIIGEITSEHEDTIVNVIYNRKCILGKEFIIRVDTVLLGYISEGEIIKVRSPGGKFLMYSSNVENYPYMRGDTVLVFLRHFPSVRCRSLRNDHKNEIGYRMPFYEVKGMYWVTSLYFTTDSLRGKVGSVTGPQHIMYHEKPYLRNEPFDYPYSEVIETLGKFIEWGKEWKKKWYNYLNPKIMDYIVLERFNSEKVIKSIIWRQW